MDANTRRSLVRTFLRFRGEIGILYPPRDLNDVRVSGTAVGGTALSDFRNRLRLLTTHPEFRRRPLLVLGRLAAWEIFKVVGHRPVISMHRESRMQLHPGKLRGIHGLVYIFREAYEPSVRYAIDRFALPGTTCYDIGANIGLWTLRMSEAVGSSGSVLAFEPLPRNASDLRRSLALSARSNVRVIEVGLGNVKDRLAMYVPPDPGASSLAPEGPGDAVVEVAIERLDDVWTAAGRPDVAVVKVDVEGAEPLVLSGGTHFFREARPVVCCEVNAWKLERMGKKPSDVIEPFTEWKYEGFVWAWRSLSLVAYDFAGNESFRDRDVLDLVFIPRERASDWL